MASKQRRCGQCGGAVRAFGPEAFTVEHRGRIREVEALSGWRCRACGEVEFDAESAARYAAASDQLVLAERAQLAAEIKRLRVALKLTQVEAARLTGGGPNAFSRYERGEARPVPAVVNLLRLLGRHPELLAEVRGA
jgi:HTH-type transcriptional regulator/antitoxin MqsA